MRQHIKACTKSGLSVIRYCAQNGIVKSAYYYWHKKLKGQSNASGFVALSVSKISSSVEIIYPDGVQLSYSGGIKTDVLKALVCCI